LIGSGEEYGKVSEEENPISEQNKTNPANIYAASKACQNMLGKIYADAYDLDIIMVRAFNHIGPGQNESFVVSDFCKQVAEIEAGKVKPVIYVGNLSAKRDFTDVRDIARAYRLLSEKGIKGEIYNIGSGKAVEVKKILELITNSSTAKIEVEIDKNKYRPVDVPVIEANIEKINTCTNWKPEIDINTTIIDTLQHWRNIIK
jgi:GDP-4-dehydro-6-deoxy-D-mannose reductase